MNALVRAAQRGDPLAMNKVLRALAPVIGPICGSIALTHGDDAMQETMIAVVRHLPSLRDPDALNAWARRIATREAVRVAQRSAVTVPVASMTELPTRATIESAVDVRDVLERLTPAQRAILVLRDVEGLTEAEVADLLTIAPGTVKSRLHRARAAFRKEWET